MAYFNFTVSNPVNTKRIRYENSLPHKSRTVFVIICILISLLYTRPTFGQAIEDSDWTFIKEENKVKYYYKISRCTGTDALILKVESKQDVAFRLDFKVQINDSDGDFEEAGSENAIIVSPAQTVIGDCDAAESDASSKLIFKLVKTYANPTVSLNVTSPY